MSWMILTCESKEAIEEVLDEFDESEYHATFPFSIKGAPGVTVLMTGSEYVLNRIWKKVYKPAMKEYRKIVKEMREYLAQE